MLETHSAANSDSSFQDGYQGHPIIFYPRMHLPPAVSAGGVHLPLVSICAIDPVEKLIYSVVVWQASLLD